MSPAVKPWGRPYCPGSVWISQNGVALYMRRSRQRVRFYRVEDDAEIPLEHPSVAAAVVYAMRVGMRNRFVPETPEPVERPR